MTRTDRRRGRQRCYMRKDKWKMIDGSWRMWEKITREESLRLDTEQTSHKKRFVRADSRL